MKNVTNIIFLQQILGGKLLEIDKKMMLVVNLDKN